MALNVLVTGAAGRTGRLVFQRLLQREDADVRGMVRSIDAAKDVLDEDGVARLVVGDVRDRASLDSALEGIDALVVLTSAVPRKKPDQAEGAPPSFEFAPGGTPELVDWEGGKNQVDVAKQKGIGHIIFVGSMGSTDPNHPLNRVGNGNILRFKRKAEEYLISSGVPYTVINPGGLINEDPGERELVAGKNDELFKVYNPPSIPRGDLAHAVEEALFSTEAKDKAFDLVCKPKGDGAATTDFESLFASTTPGL